MKIPKLLYVFLFLALLLGFWYVLNQTYYVKEIQNNYRGVVYLKINKITGNMVGIQYIDEDEYGKDVKKWYKRKVKFAK